MARLEERLRGHMRAVEKHLNMQERLDQARDAEKRELEKKLEALSKRVAKLEYRQESSDRKKAEVDETGPHDALKAMETTQRVAESKSRSKLWGALAIGVSTLFGAAAAWLTKD